MTTKFNTANTGQQSSELPLAVSHSLLTRSQLIIAAAIVTLAIANLFLIQNFISQQRQTYAYNYGQALANVAAYQAQQATMEHDLLSLQIILEDIARNPAVIGVTIHDVENKLMVQGGHDPKTRLQLDPTQALGRYNAPIVLQDSIAGYVTVILAPSIKNDTILFLKIAATSLVTLFILLWLLRRNTTTTHSKPLPIFSSQKSETQPSIDDSRNSAANYNRVPSYIDEGLNEIHRVQLQLQLSQLARFKKQLSGPNYKQLLSQFERQLRGVCSLYNGELTYANSSELLLIFNAESAADASFNALCSAHLIQQLKLHGDIELNIKAHIQTGELNLTEQLKKTKNTALLSVDNNLINEQLRHRAQFDQENFIQFESPWNDLLHKQQRQLQKLSEQQLSEPQNRNIQP